MTSNLLTRRSFVTTALAAIATLGGTAIAARTAQAEYSASEETEAALSDAQSRYEAAVAQIDELNNEYYDAEAQYNSILDQISSTETQISDLQTSIDQKQTELSQAQDVLAERVGASYRAGNVSLVDVLLQATDFEDFVSRLHYANKTADADAEAIQNVKDIKASLESDQQSLYDQQSQLETLKSEQESALADLQTKLDAAQGYANSLDDEVQSLIAQRDAEIQAAAEAARQAAEEEAARQQAEAAAAAQQSTSDDGSGDSGGSDASYDDSGSSDGGYSDDSGSSSSGGTGTHDSSVVSAAYSLIGTSYYTLDCSGLTSAAYAACGYSLYHQSGVQYNTVCSKGNLVGADGLVAGDLVFYARGGSIYHVGLYIGDGYIIDSIPSGGVQVRTLYFCDGFCGGGSPL